MQFPLGLIIISVIPIAGGELNYCLNNCQFTTEEFILVSDKILSHIRKCKDYINGSNKYRIYIEFSNEINNHLDVFSVVDLINKLNNFIMEFTELPALSIIVNLNNNNITKTALQELLSDNFNKVSIDVDHLFPITPTNIAVKLETIKSINSNIDSTDNTHKLKTSIPSFKSFYKHKMEDYHKVFQYITIDNSTFNFDKNSLPFSSDSKVFLNKTGYFIDLTNDANCLLSNTVPEGHLILDYKQPTIPENISFISTTYIDDKYYYNLHNNKENRCAIYQSNISSYKHYTYDNEVMIFLSHYVIKNQITLLNLNNSFMIAQSMNITVITLYSVY